MNKKENFFIEAENFENLGGWTLDTEFIEIMDSPYLMAHGLGQPVADASTTVDFPETGKWRVWVRTKDWVARWNAPGSPGRFQLLINNEPIKETFGTKGADWHWHDGGIVEIENLKVKLSLHDLTGFNGRCDAIYFSKVLQEVHPPDDNQILSTWRQDFSGLSDKNKTTMKFDLVVIGGGYSGMCAALSAGRSGLKVALIQNRPVLGGNASSEIKVPLRGLLPEKGPYPSIGKIVDELQYDSRPDARNAKKEDDLRYEKIISCQKNIKIYLKHHAYALEKDNNQITGIKTIDINCGCQKLIKGQFFADCTGHATIGALAGARGKIGIFSDSEYKVSKQKPVMGMTNLWSWEMTKNSFDFPETRWALDLTLEDFPIPAPGSITSTWCWESGYYHHPINDLEYIRDWNLRAVFGAWNAIKNGKKSEKYAMARLVYLSALGGLRESRRLLGDYILSAEDMINKKEFDDGFIPITWYLDRHYPDQKYMGKYPEDPFIASSIHKPGTVKQHRPRHGDIWWGIPYRCLYSKNIANLFMAGRNISTTYWGLGPVRVMRTCGMMGEVVGKAAAICVERDCQPREVYIRYLKQLKEILK